MAAGAWRLHERAATARPPRTGVASPAEIGRTPLIGRPSPSRMVQEVKPFGTELHVKALGELKMLEQAEIQVGMPRSINGDVAARISKAVLPLELCRVSRVNYSRHRRERGRVVPITIGLGSKATKFLERRHQVERLMVTR